MVGIVPSAALDAQPAFGFSYPERVRQNVIRHRRRIAPFLK